MGDRRLKPVYSVKVREDWAMACAWLEANFHRDAYDWFGVLEYPVVVDFFVYTPKVVEFKLKFG